ncbi:MAG: OsmC family protein [Crocinitomicaceae bacterium]|nr:OsmC family protein [Crocinitomicaceae bacterium]
MADTRTACVEIGESKFTSRVVVGHHEFTSDEPVSAGGSDLGPSPYELLASGLGACTVMTLQMYASLKEWDLKGVRVDVSHRKEDSEDGKSKVDVFSREIKFFGDFDEKQYKRMLIIADKCPVHKTLSASSKIETTHVE